MSFSILFHSEILQISDVKWLQMFQRLLCLLPVAAEFLSICCLCVWTVSPVVPNVQTAVCHHFSCLFSVCFSLSPPPAVTAGWSGTLRCPEWQRVGAGTHNTHHFPSVCVCVFFLFAHTHNLTQSNFSYKGDFDLHEGMCGRGLCRPRIRQCGKLSVWASMFRKGSLDAEMQSARVS